MVDPPQDDVASRCNKKRYAMPEGATLVVPSSNHRLLPWEDCKSQGVSQLGASEVTPCSYLEAYLPSRSRDTANPWTDILPLLSHLLLQSLEVRHWSHRVGCLCHLAQGRNRRAYGKKEALQLGRIDTKKAFVMFAHKSGAINTTKLLLRQPNWS